MIVTLKTISFVDGSNLSALPSLNSLNTLLKRFAEWPSGETTLTELMGCLQGEDDVAKVEEVLIKKVMKMSSALNGCHQDSAGSFRPGGHPTHLLDHKTKHQRGEKEVEEGDVEGDEEEEMEDLFSKVLGVLLLWGNRSRFHQFSSAARVETCGQLGEPLQQMRQRR